MRVPPGGRRAPADGPAGTTGLPKLIPRTHDDYLYNLRISGEICQVDADTVYGGRVAGRAQLRARCPGMLGTLLRGGNRRLPPRSDPPTIIETSRGGG